MKYIFTFFVFLCYYTLGYAQNEEMNDPEQDVKNLKPPPNTPKKSVFGTFTYMNLEYNQMDDKEMISQLTNNGIPARDLPNFSLGFGYQYYFNKIIFDMGYNFSDNKTEKNNYKSTSRYRSFRMALGYNVLPSYKFSLYPFVGFRSTIVRYTTASWTNSTLDFNNYIQENYEMHEFKARRGNLDLGIGISMMKYYLVNIRAGYIVPFQKLEWYTRHSPEPLSNVPKIQNQFYVSLSLGLGSILPRKNNNNENRTFTDGIFASNY